MRKEMNLDEAQLSNKAKNLIEQSQPYVAEVTIQGTTPLLMHAWNVEEIDEKSKANKNSSIRKTDNLESYVYRDSEGRLGISATCLHGALTEAGRWITDPRSPRKSARDLVKGTVQVLTVVAPFEPETDKWDYEDRRRVVVQRAAITRTRPAMKAGWKTRFQILVTAPEYINEYLLQSLVHKAGSFCGVCDFRPTYGRFNLIAFDLVA